MLKLHITSTLMFLNHISIFKAIFCVSNFAHFFSVHKQIISVIKFVFRYKRLEREMDEEDKKAQEKEEVNEFSSEPVDENLTNEDLIEKRVTEKNVISSSSSSTFSVTGIQSVKDHTLFTAPRQC